jgi:hypothetical protein
MLQDLKQNPSNPRSVTEDDFSKLKDSLKTFTKMLEIRPIAYDENNIIWGGNMRFEALKQLHSEGLIKEVKDSWFKKLEDYTEEEKKEFAIRDNKEFGQWDWDILANEWDDLPLEDWGIPKYWEYEDIDVGKFSITVTSEQLQVIKQAMDKVKQEQDVKDGRALELICADYLSN